ncbi:MAG: hypothetical protein J3K34DRAFT_84781 [Monoraphidium minutum]|nr:MAG: hypothetical protein J3K34DRAFT_84781 [Monoraphidium minutum]
MNFKAGMKQAGKLSSKTADGLVGLKRDVTIKINELSVVSKGGEGTQLLLQEREKPGILCFKNSYWRISLFSLQGRAVPWLPLIIYLTYTAIVCTKAHFIPNATEVNELKQLQSVTTTIGVALFLLLSFRNNAAFQRWQTGTDRFKNFCHIAKNTARVITGNLSSYLAVGGREVAYDLVLERLNWLMAALEVGRQHLRGEQNEAHLLDLLSLDDIDTLHADADPVRRARRGARARCSRLRRRCRGVACCLDLTGASHAPTAQLHPPPPGSVLHVPGAGHGPQVHREQVQRVDAQLRHHVHGVLCLHERLHDAHPLCVHLPHAHLPGAVARLRALGVCGLL